MSGRLFFLDAGRSIAISLVTGFHLWRYFGSPNFYIGPFDLYGILAHGYVGVELFFVISGYAIMMTWSRQTGDWKHCTHKFLLVRLLRIYPAYAVAVLLWILLFRQGVAPKPTDLKDIATQLTFTHTFFPETFFSISGVMWSLAVEVQFYLLFPLIMLLPLVLRASLALVSEIYIATLFLLNPTASVVWLWSVFAYIPLFLLGMAIFHIRTKLTKYQCLIWPTLFLALILILPKDSDELHMPIRISIGALLRLSVLAFARLPHSNVVSIVGKGSYSIYLYNYIFLITAAPIVRGWVSAIAYFVAVILFGLLMHNLVELPAERLRHLALKRRIEATAPVI
ncbi:acyltransferase [Ochrobactrum sp. S46]|nr:acyltransferase [Ochrobactrum sp. S45]MBK0045938.1 acyltransferase [Ochrobactrum sp. S46]